MSQRYLQIKRPIKGLYDCLYYIVCLASCFTSYIPRTEQYFHAQLAQFFFCFVSILGQSIFLLYQKIIFTFYQVLTSNKTKAADCRVSPLRVPILTFLHSVYLDYDECTSNPCLNGGTCVNGKRKFSCICPRTHKGRVCEGRRAN